ncbi:MAG: DNA translocase FtsK [Victivallales bacterium]|nr:DNA translocase FtsK [Victivallales bacterium]
MVRNETGKNNNAAASGFKFRYALYIAATLLIILALFSHNPADNSILDGGSEGLINNWIGYAGAYFSRWCFYLFGVAAFPVVGLLVICALRPLLHYPTSRRGYSGALAILIIGTAILFALTPRNFAGLTDKIGIGRADMPESALSGGVIGQILAAPPCTEAGISAGYIRRFIGEIGTVVLAGVFVLTGLVFIWMADWMSVARALISKAPEATGAVNDFASRFTRENPDSRPEPDKDDIADSREALLKLRREAMVRKLAEEMEAAAEVKELNPPPPVQTPNLNSAEPLIHATVKGESAPPPSKLADYVLPPITMLSKGPDASGEKQENIERCRSILQQTLESFNVDGHVSGIVSGPRVTRYEVSLAPGVKVEKVANIGNNIAMELEAQCIRILAPIPGKNAVGVEAPNSVAEAVYLRSMFESPQWQNSKCEIPVVLGKDVGGKPIVLDLAKAPHLLIAGATGSGKSVCMNSLIMSLLFTFSPAELRLIMVDPKVVEMEIYSTLPHLITPVVNDPHKVPTALRWAVNEMESRYRILAKAKVKNLAGYNSRRLPPEPVYDDNGEPLPDKMPILMVIIDELADIMMTDSKAEVETSIARIAQKGRAAGVHIVIATQRPSTNIITGVIKANLPTRIAFRVGSIVDSRVILDQKGAETLLGRGDMLLVPPGSAVLDRIQGAWVDDSDIAKIVDFVSGQAPQQFNNKVLSEEIQAQEQEGDFDDVEIPEASIDDVPDAAPLIRKYLEPGDDELLAKALEIVIMEQKVSTSYLQRRLKIGYNRAAELIEILEERNIVGPPGPGGSKREILVFDEIDNP